MNGHRLKGQQYAWTITDPCSARGGGTFVYLLRPLRDSHGKAISVYTFDNVNYVSWCTVRGVSVFMLEYRNVDSVC